jgi:hypothetical protein
MKPLPYGEIYAATDAHASHCFVREALAHVLLGARVRCDIDQLLLLLQRLDHRAQVALTVGKEWSNHILAGWTDRHTVGRFVVRAEGEALPE